MKVVFLDIDGVLNSTRSAVALQGISHPGKLLRGTLDGFDMCALGLMKELAVLTGCVFVLSSSWRIGHSEKECIKMGEILGLDIIGRTTDTTDGHRGSQIALWMAENQNLDITHWCIIDDDSDMLDSQLAHFVHTNVQDGFLLGDFVKHVLYLGTRRSITKENKMAECVKNASEEYTLKLTQAEAMAVYYLVGNLRGGSILRKFTGPVFNALDSTLPNTDIVAGTSFGTDVPEELEEYFNAQV